MTVLYLLATALCLMVISLLASIIPFPVRAGVWTALSFLWHAAVVISCISVIYRTAVGVDHALLPLALFAFGPGCVIAVVRITLVARQIWKMEQPRQ